MMKSTENILLKNNNCLDDCSNSSHCLLYTSENKCNLDCAPHDKHTNNRCGSCGVFIYIEKRTGIDQRTGFLKCKGET